MRARFSGAYERYLRLDVRALSTCAHVDARRAGALTIRILRACRLDGIAARALASLRDRLVIVRGCRVAWCFRDRRASETEHITGPFGVIRIDIIRAPIACFIMTVH